jgi:hypothetical protein
MVLRRHKRRVTFQAVPSGTVHVGEGKGYGTGIKGNSYGKSRLPGGVAVMAEESNSKRSEGM